MIAAIFRPEGLIPVIAAVLLIWNRERVVSLVTSLTVGERAKPVARALVMIVALGWAAMGLIAGIYYA
jgi:F0F1-type ATP synthase assembly protein I